MNGIVDFFITESAAADKTQSQSIQQEAESVVKTQPNDSNTLVETGPVLLVPIIFAVLALVAVSRRKKV